MIKTLYKQFQHWSDKGSVYIISDTHFRDPDCKTIDPNWPSPEEQLKRIKSVVHKNDTLIHLGDVGDTKYIAQLDCYKVLIMGNHDRGISHYLKKETMIDLDPFSGKEIEKMLSEGMIDRYEYSKHKPSFRGFKSNHLFDEVYDGPLWIAKKIVLSHEPLNIQPDTNIISLPIVMNLHGHTHGVPFDKWAEYRNFCADVIDYTPISLGNLIKDGLLKDITDIHRATIDHASELRTYIDEEKGDVIVPGDIARCFGLSTNEAYRQLEKFQDKGLLKSALAVECPHCGNLDTYTLYDAFWDIPEKLTCKECGEEIRDIIAENNIVVYKKI